MNRRSLFLALALLLALGAYFLFVKGRGHTSFVADETAFAQRDTAAIHKIVLTQRLRDEELPPITLEREGTEWRVNDKYFALKPRVQTLLATIGNLAVRQPLNEAAQKMGLEMMEHHHIQVELLDAKDDMLKSYRIGTEVAGAKGSVMQLDGAKTPYVVSLPGFNGFVNLSYSLDLLFWRENLLFDGSLPKLQAIRFDYEQAENSFVAKRNGNTWQVEGIKADTAKLNAWLRHFTGKIFAETFAEKDFPNKRAELVATQRPMLMATFIYTDGKTRQFKVFRRPDTRENYFGWIEGENELLTIQDFVFGKFMKTKQAFL